MENYASLIRATTTLGRARDLVKTAGIGLGAPSEAYNCIKHLSDRRATAACIPSGERQDLCATNQPPARQSLLAREGGRRTGCAVARWHERRCGTARGGARA